MAKRKEIIAVSYIELDGTTYEFNSLSEKKRRECITRMMKNAGNAVSDYLNTHPDEARDYIENARAEGRLVSL